MKAIKKSSNKSFANKLGVFAASLLFTAVAVYLYSPVIGTNASDSANIGVNLRVNSIISLALSSNSLNFAIVPTTSGVFSSQSVQATVETNSTEGYELFFSSVDNQTNMPNQDQNVSGFIASDFSGTVTSSTMASNKWGYSLNNTDFSRIPTLNTQATIKNIDHYPASNEKITSVYIGTKISTALPFGTYSKDVVLSVIAHDTPVFNGISTMQQMTPEACSLERIGAMTTLTDTRDGNSYIVKKLADGNCWMIQNLRLGDDHTAMTLHPSDSNVTADFELPAAPTTLTPGVDFEQEVYDVNGIYIDNTYGGLYSYYTATAGEGTESKASGNVEQSICPKGWRLPTGGTNGEFSNLYTYYNSFLDMRDANGPNFTLSGYAMNGAYLQKDAYGTFWSSTVNDSDKAYVLFFYTNGTNSVLPENYGDKSNGYSIRCVAIPPDPAPGIHSISTMQEMTSQVCADTTTPDDGSTVLDTDGSHHGDDTYVPSAVLTDSRDNNTYTVRKLADGKCWMTDNLRIGSDTTMTLYPSSSDIAEEFELPASSSNDDSTYNAKKVYIDDTYGGFYNFYTATAGEGTRNRSTNTEHSICPRGWRLPTGGDNGEFQTLYGYYNSSSSMQGAPGLTLSGGLISGTGFDSQGYYGYFWSSTPVSNDTDRAHDFLLYSPSISETSYPADGTQYKYQAWSIRCLAR